MIVYCMLLVGLIGSVWLLFLRTDPKKRLVEASVQDSSQTIGCKTCHIANQPSHDLHAVFDCNACHLGDANAKDAATAHAGMVLIPGNLNDAQQTCGVCHAQEVSDVHHSLMTTNAGIVAVDRFVFGEQETPNGTVSITEIGHSAADSHLRNLCSSCHLGKAKLEFGPIDDASRGGGCNACHLNYHEEALAQLNAYQRNPQQLPATHPTLDLNISDQHCMGCHSRSGRISMNYQGFHETQIKTLPAAPVGQYMQLQDGRVFTYVKEDVHHQLGLSCIDCHNYADVMGGGGTYLHEEHAVKVRCEDCHTESDSGFRTVTVDRLKDVYKRIYDSRKFVHKTMLATGDGGIPLVNSYLPGDGKAYLYGKLDRSLHEMQSPAEVCSREYGHRNLSCSACHTSWAPQCIECHTEYDPDMEAYDLLANQERIGGWVEIAGDMRAEAPALGVYETENGPSIQPAIPGMIMTLDKSAYVDAPKQAVSKQYSEFHRLFAPAAPHTTSSEGRSCRSCHLNPVALGYGRGKLSYDPSREGSGWSFEPEGMLLQPDGLPVDAWIPFLGERKGTVSTRMEFHPLSIDEQRRILRVGTCLSCHEDGSKAMLSTLQQDFEQLFKKLPQSCAEL